ncbi:MAG: Gfo/Idh/MocA family oxidoreductase [Planctomycetota bacterium]
MSTVTDPRTAGTSGTKPKRLRCGAVGVGRMGRHHARVYAEMPEVDLVGIVDHNLDRAKELAERHNTDAFDSVDALLEAGVDAVSIATPTIYHVPSATPFLKNGVACLIEKPLAADAEEALHLAELAEQGDACLMVGHIERFNPVMRAMQRATVTGRGEQLIPRFMDIVRVSPMTFRSLDIGVVMDMMIHDLDVVIMLMGGREPDEVQASGVPVLGEHEDLCNARLVWNRGADEGGGQCVANLTASRLAMKTERVTRITSENGYIKIDYAQKTGTIIRRTGNEIQMQEVRDQINAGADLSDLNWAEIVNIEPLQIDDAEPIVMEIRSFLDAVREGEHPPIDARAGMANIRTAERIVAATRESLGRSAH